MSYCQACADKERRIAELESQVGGMESCVHSHDEDMRSIAHLESKVAELQRALEEAKKHAAIDFNHAALIAATREECAKVADKHPGDIGAAIRALTRPPGD